MIFEWDEAKSEGTHRRRGFAFSDVARVFSDPQRLERIDKRRNYGEERRQTVGEIDGKTFFVAFMFRGSTVRIISARRANEQEDAAYRKSTAWR